MLAIKLPLGVDCQQSTNRAGGKNHRVTGLSPSRATMGQFAGHAVAAYDSPAH
jgi:hypothetical protein